MKTGLRIALGVALFVLVVIVLFLMASEPSYPQGKVKMFGDTLYLFFKTPNVRIPLNIKDSVDIYSDAKLFSIQFYNVDTSGVYYRVGFLKVK